ncbi:HD-GYP domain-containing protein [Marinobacteraceae bacterium S3BR75-40.1]
MTSPKTSFVHVPVEKLQIGFFVDLELPWTDHPFLFRRFRIKTEDEIRVIRKLLSGKIKVYPKKSLIAKGFELAAEAKTSKLEEPARETESENALWEDKRAHIDQAKAFREERRKLLREYKQTAQRVRRFTNELSTAPANAIRDAESVVNDMAVCFEQGESVLMNLINLADDSFSTYAHSLNVTVLSLALGRSLQLGAEELRLLAMGALLHDIGQVTLPKQLLIQKQPLNAGEQKVYETHAIQGGKLARNVGTLDDAVIVIIEQHHELLDGSGYPNGLKGEKIERLARIVSIANTYDNLCNPRDPARALPPKLAMAYLYRNYNHKLDSELLAHFIKSMGVYPPGTVVKLSDGSIGLVTTVNPDHLLKPEVLIYNPDIPKNEAVCLNLMERDDIAVEDTLKPDEYPKRIYDYLGIHERVGYFYSKAGGRA